MGYNCDDCRSDCAEIQKALCHKSHIETAKQLQAELEKYRWIPVEEGPPELCSPYTTSKDIELIYKDRDRKPRIALGYYEKDSGWVIYSSYDSPTEYQDKITHWRYTILP